MSAHPSTEELEAVAGGQAAPAVEEHVAQCAECGRELSWLKAERALISRREAPPVQHLWAGIEARIAQQQKPRAHRPRWARRVGVAAAAVSAVAALALIVLRPWHPPAPVSPATPQTQAAQREPEERLDPKTLAALDRAEADYRDAARALEEEYARLRPHLDPAMARRWDETLTRARAQLGEARAVAAEDVNARMQVLDGYAGYVRSLRTLVQHSQEANP